MNILNNKVDQLFLLNFFPLWLLLQPSFQYFRLSFRAKLHMAFGQPSVEAISQKGHAGGYAAS